MNSEVAWTLLQETTQYAVCIKPIGVLSEEGGMPDLIRERLGGEAFCVHRLDRAVGGIMIYARTQKAAARLSESIQNGAFEKEYLAVVSGCPENAQGEYRDLLWKDSGKSKAFVVKRKRSGVKEAALRYQVIQSVSEGENVYTLVRIRLITGRFHQIRVQFASRKMPLLGDGKYGSRIKSCPIALWSTKIVFTDPETGKEETAEAFPQDTFPWSLFDKEGYLKI